MRDVDEFLPLPQLPYYILLALGEGGSLHGWAIIKRIGEISSGRTKPSSGSLYLAMGRLRERGLIDEAPTPVDETDARRRYHKLTPLGQRVLSAETERLAGLVQLARAATSIRRGEGGNGSG